VPEANEGAGNDRPDGEETAQEALAQAVQELAA
jgi:hypothetical protein